MENPQDDIEGLPRGMTFVISRDPDCLVGRMPKPLQVSFHPMLLLVAKARGREKEKGKGSERIQRARMVVLCFVPRVVLTHIYGDNALSLRVQAMARAARRHPWQC